MKFLTFLIFITISISAVAQDRIIKKSGTIIEGKVSEIAADEVKYYYPDNPKLIFGIDKVLVEKIEFGTGEVIVVEGNTFKNSEYYIGQNKRALKLNFTSPFTGSTELVYEQNIKPGRSWETALGIIGLGFDAQENNPRGVFGKFAYKFLKDPDFYMQRMHYAHILKGGYIAPELALRYMSFDSDEYLYSMNTGSVRKESFALAVMLKFGKQWVFDDAFLVDIFGGIGYGFGGDDYDINVV
jgi:hypothetical protein